MERTVETDMLKFSKKETIQKGYQYFNEGRVSRLTLEEGSTPKKRYYTATVMGMAKKFYRVWFCLDQQMNLLDADCDCPAFESYDGPCKHIAAAVFQLNCEQRSKGSGQTPLTTLREQTWMPEPLEETAEPCTGTETTGADANAMRPAAGSAVGGYREGPGSAGSRAAKAMQDGVNAEGIPTEGIRTKSIKTEGTKTGTVKIEYMKAERTKTEEAKTTRSTVGQEAPALRLRRNTSAALLKCMEQMEKAQPAGEAETVQRGSVHIVPTLIWEHGKMRVEITVGRERQYVVRSLVDFCRSLRNGEPLSFGKGLYFHGTLQAFDEESYPLAKFFMRKYHQLDELKRLKNSFGGPDLAEHLFTDKGRSMRLTPEAVDELLALLHGQAFVFDKKERYRYNYQPLGARRRERLERGFTSRVHLQEGDPLIPLHIAAEQDGVLLRTEELPFRCQGETSLYLLFGSNSEIMWKSSLEYARTMGAFLESMEEADLEIFISERDITQFCVSVFSAIRGWLSLQGDAELLESYMPWDMEGQVYLDSPSTGVVTAKVYGDYGECQVNLYNHSYECDKQPIEAAEAAAKGLRRNEVQERRLCRLLELYFSNIDMDRGMLFIKDNDDGIYNFLTQGQAEVAGQARLFVTDRYRRLMFPAKNKMAAGVSISGELLRVTFDLEGFPAEEMAELLAAYRVRRKYYRLRSGAFLSMEDGEIQDAMQLAAGLQLTREEMNAGQAVLPRYRALYVDEMEKRAAHLSLRRDESFSAFIRKIRDIDETELPVPESLASVLRDYQKTGYRWLKTMANLGFGAILADDMGLGKTLEMIALLVSVAQEGGVGTDAFDKEISDVLALVVCPASLVWNWQRELQRFAPQLIPVMIAGTASQRKSQLQEVKRRTVAERGALVVITSYDLLRRDVGLYDALYFHYHIIDEAQYIKNFATKNAKAVNALCSGHRFALTGTPVENRLSDLWSIVHFLMPGYLGSYQQFRQQYERPILEERDEAANELLHNQVRPFILRRLKQKVLKELPEKVESVVYVPLKGEQQKLYMANLAKVKLEVGKEIREGGFESNKLQVLALLMRLRQLCCHPALCYENYQGESAKLEVCMELIRQAINGGHRMLLFSQFTTMLSLIEAELKKEKIGYFLLTGQTPKAERQRLMTEFNEGRIPVFLISLKAGGTGLNLTGADIVIHYDPWWNLAAQNQATDRAYRMGQHNSVQVYKLVADGTIEEKILHLQEHKNQLADSVITENSALFGGIKEDQLRELFDLEGV